MGLKERKAKWDRFVEDFEKLDHDGQQDIIRFMGRLIEERARREGWDR